MAQSKAKNGRVGELLILAFVIAGVLLVLAELGTNVAAELENYRTSADTVIRDPATPTPIPTLTKEEYEQYLREHPIGG
jgi:hypothetical protein